MKSVEKIIAVVITYHPNREAIENISKLLDYYEYVVVVDNTEEAGLLEMLSHENISIIENKNNLGVAKALNLGVIQAEKLGADWVTTFDQDSELVKDYPNLIFEFLSKRDTKLPSPILGCAYEHPEVQQLRPSLKRNSDESFEQCSHVISSGMSFSITSYNAIGGFDSDLFIDHVDHDFCAKGATLGIPCYVTSVPVLLHTIGAQTQHNLFGKSFITTNHSAERRYYMVRNYLHFRKNYQKSYPDLDRLYKTAMMKSWVIMALFERQKIKKIWFVVRGVWDGIWGRKGKL